MLLCLSKWLLHAWRGTGAVLLATSLPPRRGRLHPLNQQHFTESQKKVIISFPPLLPRILPSSSLQFSIIYSPSCVSKVLPYDLLYTLLCQPVLDKTYVCACTLTWSLQVGKHRRTSESAHRQKRFLSKDGRRGKKRSFP